MEFKQLGAKLATTSGLLLCVCDSSVLPFLGIILVIGVASFMKAKCSPVHKIHCPEEDRFQPASWAQIPRFLLPQNPLPWPTMQSSVHHPRATWVPGAIGKCRVTPSAPSVSRRAGWEPRAAGPSQNSYYRKYKRTHTSFGVKRRSLISVTHICAAWLFPNDFISANFSLFFLKWRNSAYPAKLLGLNKIF